MKIRATGKKKEIKGGRNAGMTQQLIRASIYLAKRVYNFTVAGEPLCSENLIKPGQQNSSTRNSSSSNRFSKAMK